jgi:hypothetical protein
VWSERVFELRVNSDLAEWCYAMATFAEGRSTLSNLLYDVEQGRLPAATVRTVLKSLIDAWAASKMREFPDQVAQGVFLDPSLRHKGRPVPDLGAVSRVMDARAFAMYNLDTQAMGLSLLLDEEDVEEIASNGLTDRKTGADAAKGVMTTSTGTVWVTVARLGDRLRAAGVQQADLGSAARRVLGLEHFRYDQLLIEIIYPTPLKCSARVPTFVEGCPALKYRSKDGSDGWGRTVDLSSLEDGEPEAVISALVFSSDYEVSPLGKLAPASVPFDWGALLEKMPAPFHLPCSLVRINDALK